MTEPWPWWTTIGRFSWAHRARAAEPVGSSSSIPTSGTKARARIVPAASSIQAQAKEEARKGAERGKEEARKGIEKGAKEAEKGLEKGKEEAQRGIEEGEKYQQKYAS
jgi:hypothetical protein